MSQEAILKALGDIQQRLAAIESKVGSGSSSSSSSSSAAAAAAPAGGSAAADAFQALVDEHLSEFAALSTKIGGDVGPLGGLILDAAAATKALIQTASESKKPADADLGPILAPLSSKIAAINDYRDKHRATKEKNHLFACAESSGVFGWVAVPKTPGPYAKEMGDSAKFYTNKILQEFKGNEDKTQVNWVKAYVGFLEGLVGYIKQYHTTGLTWNPKGGAAATPKAAPAAAAPAAKKVAPRAAAQAASGGLFAELNKGGAVTSGLKKVDRSETNKDKKISGVVKSGPVKKKTPAPKQPPVCELRGNKWAIEFQHHPDKPITIKVEKKQAVYIYKCENATILIEGRCNSICVDGSKKTGIAFDGCVATFEIVNSQSITAQVKGVVPTVSIDKTAGAMIILSKESIDTQIVSGTSSEMNVQVPGKDDNSDPIEIPIAEQFLSVYQDGKLVTTPVDHTGG